MRLCRFDVSLDYSLVTVQASTLTRAQRCGTRPTTSRRSSSIRFAFQSYLPVRFGLTDTSHPQETNVYYPWSQCKPLLDIGSRITSFATVPDPLNPSVPVALEGAASGAPQTSHDKPETSTRKEGDKDDEDCEQGPSEDEEDDEDDDDVDFPSPPPPGCLEPTTLSKDLLLRALALERRAIMPLLVRPCSLPSGLSRPHSGAVSSRCLALIRSYRPRGTIRSRRQKCASYSHPWEKGSWAR